MLSVDFSPAEFITNKLDGAVLKEWSSSLDTFDFEITHRQRDLSDKTIRSWLVEFFLEYPESVNLGEIEEKELIVHIVSEEGEYLLTISNYSSLQKILGTLAKLP